MPISTRDIARKLDAPSHRPVTTYNSKNADEWKDKRDFLIRQFYALKHAKTESAKQLETLQKGREAMEFTIATRRDLIAKKIETDRKTQQKHDAKSPSIVNLFKREVVAVGQELYLKDIEEEIVGQLERQLAQGVEEFFDPLLNYYERVKECKFDQPIAQLQQQIANEDRSLRSVYSEGKQVSIWATEAPQFLAKLQLNPDGLCRSIQTKLEKFIDDYEEENPADQSTRIQLILRQLSFKLKAIIETTSEGNDSRQKYLHICTLLWAIEDYFADQLRLTEAECKLRDELFAYLNSMHINREDGIPDQTEIKDTCAKLISERVIIERDEMAFCRIMENEYKAERDRFNEHFQSLHNESQRLINEVIDKQYPRVCGGPVKISIIEKKRREEEARDILSRTDFSPGSDESKKAIRYQMLTLAVSNALEFREYTDHHVNESSQNIKFCTTLLRKTREIMTDGMTSNDLIRYGRLIDKAPGTPSWKLRLVSAGVALGGLAIMGLSVFATFATFGAATPLTIFGLKFGASLTVAAITYTAGLTTFGIGEYGFLKSMRGRLSEKIKNMHTVAQKRYDSGVIFKAEKRAETPDGRHRLLPPPVYDAVADHVQNSPPPYAHVETAPSAPPLSRPVFGVRHGSNET